MNKIFLVASCALFSISFNALAVSSEFYGFFKGSVFHSTDAVNSFYNPNMVAPTSVSYSPSLSEADATRTTLQVGQSRLGTNIKGSSKTSANVEIDFVDFGQSSPTTSSHPRLRKAYLNYQITDDALIRFGQDWDSFSPFNPITFNYIGNYFNSGNVGFMRQQAKYIKKKGSYEYNLTIGQAGKNSSGQDSDLEKNNSLSYSGYVQKILGNHIVNLSAITARIRGSSKKETVWGSSLGHKYKNNFFETVSEFYYGEGLSQVALLSLPTTDVVKEYGAHLTAKVPTKKYDYYAGFGFAKNKDSSTSVFSSSSEKFTTLGAQENYTYKLGLSKNVDEFLLFTEAARLKTVYQSTSYYASTIELGAVYKF